MSDWRQDPDLVREDAEPEPDVPLDERWAGIFDVLIPQVLGDRATAGIIKHAVRLMVHQGRKYVARHPDEARATVIQAIQMVAAQLRIEPGEVYTEGG